ncbi:uncharacterized protein LOC118468400 [Anopheles albimanus]|uniref:uncharacterized protein LOC118468400 n=1 Tax=Anopheles albimanus TaxID=7167 RepID=UPI00163E5AC6|nr:uncharacterized protein LOC118468400 [Anopheles albimanus]
MPYREERLPLAGMWQNSIIGYPFSAFEMLSKRIDSSHLTARMCTSIKAKCEFISPDNSMNYGDRLAATGTGDGPCNPGHGVEAVAEEGHPAVSREQSSNSASDVESNSDQGSTTTMNNFDSYVLLQNAKEQPDSTSPSRFPPVSPGKYDHVKSKVLQYIKGNQLNSKK